jgi:hypothetical protein
MSNIRRNTLLDLSARKDESLIEVLYVLFFLVHATFCYYTFFNGIPPIAGPTQSWISEKYALMGFDWSHEWAAPISLAVISSFILNAIRRGVEGWMLGWPRFSMNDSKTTLYFTIRATGYFVLVILVLGAYGELRSQRVMDGFEVAFLAIATFIFGLLINVIDDFISSLIQVVFKGGRL